VARRPGHTGCSAAGRGRTPATTGGVRRGCVPTGVLPFVAAEATDYITGRTVNTDGGTFRAAAGVIGVVPGCCR
ncbi:hypothetical protein AB0L50_33810, partial [Streptomyces flaveolus]|uniref:hypothetical protein n=1 Tax=Streptomyces flaveolus TaxID=67297 RepID=UPI00343CDAE8